MAIPRVSLNIDPRGYAGSIVSPIGVGGMGERSRGGFPFEIPDHLKRQMALRNAIAREELQMLRQELNERRRPRPSEGLRQKYESQILEAAAKEAGGRARSAQEQGQQEAIATMARRGRLGQAMSNPSPETWGKLDRTAAYGTLSGLSGNSGIAPTDPMDYLRGQADLAGFIGARGQRSEANRYGYGGNPDAEAWSRRKSGFLNEEPEVNPYPGGYTTSKGRGGSFTNSNLYRKGTLPGTLPEDQIAEVHKGEAIISEDQVDLPLMHYLMNDKLRKMRSGVMDGKGTGPGMPSYARGSITYPNEAMERDQMLALMRSGGDPGSVYTQEPETGPGRMEYLNPFSQYWKDYAASGEANSLQDIRENMGEAVAGGVGNLIPESFQRGPGTAAEMPPEAPAMDSGGMGFDAAAGEPETLQSRMLEDALSRRDQPDKIDVTSKAYRDEQNLISQASDLRNRASRMQTYLTSALVNGSISDDMYKSMTRDIDRYDKAADMAERRIEATKERELDKNKAAEERVQEAYETGISAEAVGDEKTLARFVRQRQDAQEAFDKAQEMYWKSGDDETKSTNALKVMAHRHQVLRALEGKRLDQKQAMAEVLHDMGQIDDEELAQAMMAGG